MARAPPPALAAAILACAQQSELPGSLRIPSGAGQSSNSEVQECHAVLSQVSQDGACSMDMKHRVRQRMWCQLPQHISWSSLQSK